METSNDLVGLTAMTLRAALKDAARKLGVPSKMVMDAVDAFGDSIKKTYKKSAIILNPDRKSEAKFDTTNEPEPAYKIFFPDAKGGIELTKSTFKKKDPDTLQMVENTTVAIRLLSKNIIEGMKYQEVGAKKERDFEKTHSRKLARQR